MTESKFRERRSAFVEEDEEGQEETDEALAAEPSPAEPSSAGPPPAAAPRAGPTETGPLGAREEDRDGGEFDPLEGIELPEASFLEIVQYFAIQAIQFLGDMPLNEEGERRVMPREAKHFIDLLGILEDRTRGNLTAEEARYLDGILTDLRLRYLRIG
ncbi:MAG TPA: DUF1844 domain-containing protein [Gemmatimonadota bacterium]|nr:DUF1844 domain-containing protein [Gemmatimonadota bacterium]